MENKEEKTQKLNKKNKQAKVKYIDYEYDFPLKVKVTFEKKYRSILNEQDYQNLIKYSLTYPRKSIRINTLKVSAPEKLKLKLEKQFNLDPIPWQNYAYYIKALNSDRRDLGNTIEHALGYIYIQESASMVPVNAFGNDLVKDGVILDMCASPGSKTTQLSQLMDNKGLIIANELDGKRIASLGQNIQRVGCTNIVITHRNAARISNDISPNTKFDNILLDAPCSGLGTLRKSPDTMRTWNPRLHINMSKRQRKLIDAAFNMLKVGGVMIYSTCSIEPEENEGIVDWLLRKYDNAKVLPIDLDIKRSKPVIEFGNIKYDESIKETLRIWPYDNNTDGFYVAKIKKL